MRWPARSLSTVSIRTATGSGGGAGAGAGRGDAAGRDRDRGVSGRAVRPDSGFRETDLADGLRDCSRAGPSLAAAATRPEGDLRGSDERPARLPVTFITRLLPFAPFAGGVAPRPAGLELLRIVAFQR